MPVWTPRGAVLRLDGRRDRAGAEPRCPRATSVRQPYAVAAMLSRVNPSAPSRTDSTTTTSLPIALWRARAAGGLRALAHLAAAFVVAHAAAGTAHGQQAVTFGNGAAMVTLPGSFAVAVHPDGTLVASFGRRADHRLGLRVTEVNGGPGETRAGENFVRNVAARKGLRVFQDQDKLVYMDPAPDTRVGDTVFRTVHWQIGFGNLVVGMTLTAPAEATPELTAFFGKPFNDIVRSLRRKDA